jgi:hypothetical protein
MPQHARIMQVALSGQLGNWRDIAQSHGKLACAFCEFFPTITGFTGQLFGEKSQRTTDWFPTRLQLPAPPRTDVTVTALCDTAGSSTLSHQVMMQWDSRRVFGQPLPPGFSAGMAQADDKNADGNGGAQKRDEEDAWTWTTIERKCTAREYASMLCVRASVPHTTVLNKGRSFSTTRCPTLTCLLHWEKKLCEAEVGAGVSPIFKTVQEEAKRQYCHTFFTRRRCRGKGQRLAHGKPLIKCFSGQARAVSLHRRLGQGPPAGDKAGPRAARKTPPTGAQREERIYCRERRKKRPNSRKQTQCMRNHTTN